MLNRQWIFVAGLVACGCVLLQVAGRLSAQQNDGVTKSDNASDKAKESNGEHELDLRYAKAYLRLMEVTLDRYQEANRRQPNSISPSVIQLLQENVRAARDREQLVEKNDMKGAEIYVAGAESELRAAQESLRTAEQANALSAGAVSTPQVEVLRANVELAKIRAEKAHDMAAESPLSNVQFELGQLREQVQQLQMYVTLLRVRN